MTNAMTNTTTRKSFARNFTRGFALMSVMLVSMVLSLAFLPLGTRGEAKAALNDAQRSARALEFITLHGTVMAAILMNDNMPNLEKRLKLKSIMEENFDLKTMIRAIVGPYWRKMIEPQRIRYQEASSQWVVLYSANFMSTVKPIKFEVLSASPLGKDVLVETETQAKRSDEPFKMLWRVRFDADDKATLIDMHFRGLSMIAAQRGEVSAIVAEQGIPVFLDTLDERLKKIKQEFNKP